MIRTLLYSKRPNLEHALGATLGSDIDFRVESEELQFLAQIQAKKADVIIVDLNGRTAALDSQLELIAKAQEPGLPVLVMTDDDRRSTALELMQRGVCDHFRNPPSPLEMTIVIRRVHEYAQMRRELATARESMGSGGRTDQMIGRSRKMLAVYDLIHRVADLETGVLITGESGTGKELVARAIHNLGSRASAPFVAVSCGAIPETLIEAELFGHEKGAYTGANGTRQGLFEMAGDGTLFLDEIGELSANTQVKLLRVIQQREFSRLGGNRTIALKARIVFATHRDLSKMVEEGNFRSDLFFRINVINIQVPPLRDRAEDIAELASNFIETLSASCKKQVVGIKPAVLTALMNYDWPGNVRELQNAIHRAVIVSSGDHINLEDLPETLQCSTQTMPIPVSSTFDRLLREFKRKIANDAIADCNGNKTMAAMNLQISRTYLHRLLRSDSDDDSRVA
ncbi:MAG: sigma-54 dependent transcriptional regulator [Acidobacteriota bacterium]